MGPLRIVLVMLDPPLPFGKAMGRWFYALLRGLAGRGHEVTAFAACATPGEAEAARALFPAPAFDLRCHVFPERRGLAAKWETLRRPYSYAFGPALRRDLDAELARGFDVLHLEVLWSGWLGRSQARRAVLNVPYLYELDWADLPAPRSLGDRLRRLSTYRAEHELLRSYPNIIAVSPRLQAHIRRLAPRASVAAIPFAMDLSLYPFEPRRPAPRPPTVGLIASFNWTPGLAAGHRLLDRLWPEVKRRVPDARLELAGVGARASFPGHLDRPDVRIVDRVDDVAAFFRGIDLLLYAPNHSSGMKFKTLEAFAFGVPVVTTADGVEGLPAADGVHAGICEDDAGLVDRAVALLEDPALRDRRCLEARALLESHCGPDAVLDRLEPVYASILDRLPAGRAPLPTPARP